MDPNHKQYIRENADSKSAKEIARTLGIKEKNAHKFMESIKHEKKPALTGDTRHILLAIILIAVLGFTIYGNAINGPFIWDDIPLIEKNEYLKHWRYLPDIFTKNIGAGGRGHSSSYRPIQIITYMVDHYFWGDNAKGYHFTNVLMHVITGIMVYWFIIVLFNNHILSLFTSLLFMAHPTFTEAIAYISGRADPITLSLMLLSFIAYIKSPPGRIDKFYLLMIISYVLAVLSRESSIILPGLITVYSYTFGRKLDKSKFTALLGLALLYLSFRLFIFSSVIPHTISATNVFQRLPGVFVALFNYLRLLILPLDLHMEYGNPSFKWLNPKAITGLIIFITAMVYAVKFRKKNTLICFGIFWFFAALLPSWNIYPLGYYMSEHWLYLPSIGVFLVAAHGLEKMYKTVKYKPIAVLSLAGIIGFFSCLTIKQNTTWLDPMKFYERAIQYAPNSGVLHNNLGILYGKKGEYEKAVVLFKTAIRKDPNYVNSYTNLGHAYKLMNQPENAVKAYIAGAKMFEDYQTYHGLGLTYLEMGKYTEAIDVYNKVIDLTPEYPEAHYYKGNALFKLGHHAEAERAYKEAIRLNPDYAFAYNTLGNIYSARGDFDKAIKLYSKAIELDPYIPEIYNNIGIVFTTLNRYEEAIQVYKKVLDLKPKSAKTYNHLATLYYHLKEYDKALSYCNRAQKMGTASAWLLRDLEPYRKEE